MEWLWRLVVSLYCNYCNINIYIYRLYIPVYNWAGSGWKAWYAADSTSKIRVTWIAMHGQTINRSRKQRNRDIGPYRTNDDSATTQSMHRSCTRYIVKNNAYRCIILYIIYIYIITHRTVLPLLLWLERSIWWQCTIQRPMHMIPSIPFVQRYTDGLVRIHPYPSHRHQDLFW